MDGATPASPRVEKRFDPDKVLCGPESEPWPGQKIKVEVIIGVSLEVFSKCVLTYEAFCGLIKLRGCFNMLFAFWTEFLFCDGFAPGPPKKPPPWSILFVVLFIRWFNSVLLY